MFYSYPGGGYGDVDRGDGDQSNYIRRDKNEPRQNKAGSTSHKSSPLQPLRQIYSTNKVWHRLCDGSTNDNMIFRNCGCGSYVSKYELIRVFDVFEGRTEDVMDDRVVVP